MKKVYLLGILFFAVNVFAQNVGINNNDPKVSLDVQGGLATRGTSISPTGNAVNIPSNVSFVSVDGGSATDTISCFFSTAYINGQRLIIYNNNATIYPLRFMGSIIPKNQIREFIYGTSGGWALLSGALEKKIDSLWYAYKDSIAVTNKKYVIINTNPETLTPIEGFMLDGNLLIQQNAIVPQLPPTLSQTYTMNNTNIFYYTPNTDSVGRIFDPGGQNINYTNNAQGYISVSDFSDNAYNIKFNSTDFGLALGDTLWIGENSVLYKTNYFLRLTNTSQSPKDFNINTNNFVVVFKANADNLNAKGFDITWKKIYPIYTASDVPLNPFGYSLFFNSQKGSFQVGYGNKQPGSASLAIGYEATATGTFATAIGESAKANGYRSTAIGYGTIAGNSATAIGYVTQALGNYSTAIGRYSIARGGRAIAIGESTEANVTNATAMGLSTNANGVVSTAMGNNTTANGTNSTSMGNGTNALSFNSLAIGSFNDSIAISSPNTWISSDPIMYIGNGQTNLTRSNAMVVYKNANVDINGFTRLGKASEDAPIIKMKEIIGIGPNGNNATIAIPHGLTASKIISVSMMSEFGAGSGDLIPPNYKTGNPSGIGFEYTFQVRPNDIFVSNVNGNSAGLTNRAVKILITYKE
jgi:hypothetical protein